MGERDAIVDEYIWAVTRMASLKAGRLTEPELYAQAHIRVGHYQGVLRTLATEVAGVREWLAEHIGEVQ